MNHTMQASHPGGPGLRQRRLQVNITPAERTGRVVLGIAATAVAVALLTGAGSVVAIVLELLLLAAGADLAITGALGHCPLYNKLGYVPPSLRSRT
jgi:hypothetical protein